MNDLNDQVVKAGFDSNRARIKLAWAMTPEVEKKVVANNVGRMVLERLTKDQNVEIRYDINTVCLPSHGAEPERGPCFAAFYEIVSYVTHTERLVTVDDAMPILNEAGLQIRIQEEANFFAMADVAASKTSARTLTQAVNDLTNKGASTIAVCGYQYQDEKTYADVYSYEDNHKLKNEIELLSKLHPDVVIIPTLSVPENQVYGFVGKVGQFWVQQGLEIIPADEMAPRQRGEKNIVEKYGYIFSEIISVGITKPDLVFKACLE